MLQGSCLCGAIRIRVQGRHSGVAHCHCSRCRKVSGVGSFAHVIVPVGGLAWVAGEDQVAHFALPSGYETRFCRVCGSPAPDLGARGTHYRVPVGLFDGAPRFQVTEHIFVGSKAAWDAIGDDASQFPGDGPPRKDLQAFEAADTSG